jgi:hypothetical protein
MPAREGKTFYRDNRTGKRRWVGQVIIVNGQKPHPVVAECYGSTEEEVRRRREAVLEALRELEGE